MDWIKKFLVKKKDEQDRRTIEIQKTELKQSVSRMEFAVVELQKALEEKKR